MADPNNLIHALRPREPGHLRKTLHFSWDRRHVELGKLLRAIHATLRPGISLGEADQIVTDRVFIGAIPFDGNTSTIELLMDNGSQVGSWVGEDYGHKELEVTLLVPDSSKRGSPGLRPTTCLKTP